MNIDSSLLIAAGVFLTLLLWMVVSYNRFVSQKLLVSESWKQVDVELQRRHDLIPNLASTVRGYAEHESSAFDAVTATRASALNAGPSLAARERAEQASAMALAGLLAIAESYPDLKADGIFIALSGELAETENRIAAARRFYNNNVRAYNTRVATFPSAIVAKAFKFVAVEYFESSPGSEFIPTVRPGD